VTGKEFNQPLVNWSPPASLTELFIGNEYGSGWWDHPVTQLRLPPNLHKLTFGHAFDRALSGVEFPSSLRVLQLGRNFNHSLSAAAWTPPPSLEEFDMSRCKSWNRSWTDLHLPPTLRKLTFSDYFSQPLKDERGKCTLILPATLTERLRIQPVPTQPPSAILTASPLHPLPLCQLHC